MVALPGLRLVAALYLIMYLLPAKELMLRCSRSSFDPDTWYDMPLSESVIVLRIVKLHKSL